MTPTEIAARRAALRAELYELDRAVEALAADIGRDGVPTGWGPRDRDEAHMLFVTVKDTLPEFAYCADRRDALTSASRAIAAGSFHLTR